MQIDLIGRIKNTSLPTSKALLPLYEAIVNAIYAIQEAKTDAGKIDIHIIREESLISENDESYLSPIIGFRIVDNGIGFNTENFESFSTSDSTIKQDRGGKGIGRLLWLKAFDYVEVNSVFEEGGIYYKRYFQFRPTHDGIIDDRVEEHLGTVVETIVELKNVKKKYQNVLPKRSDTIADRIIEHCLSYLLLSSCPTINLYDADKIFCINKIFEEAVLGSVERDNIEIKDQQILLTSLKLYGGAEASHKIHFCANDREVSNDNLTDYIVDLNKKLVDADDRTFVYHCYVSSLFLDEIVNAERTDFNYSIDENGLFENEIARSEFKREIAKKIKEKLAPYLDLIKDQKRTQIVEFISSKAPQYRHLLKREDKLLDEVPYGVSDEKLDLMLYKIGSEIEVEVKAKGDEILNYNIEDPADWETYKCNFFKYIDEINDIGQSKLSQYIIHRKLILELLNTRLSKTDEGKYQLEESIHEIIFPMRTTSSDVSTSKQNLWLIDEKLSFHYYLASDLPFKKMEVLDSDSKDRPDILIVYDNPILFVDSDPPYDSCTLIEFKRPMRSAYSDDEGDPIDQVLGYIDKIKESKRTTKDSRPIIISQTSRFYCYIIADLTPKLQSICKKASYTPTPDNLGYFTYNPNYNAYIEVISYDKLMNDAKKRNAILFQQLGLRF